MPFCYHSSLLNRQVKFFPGKYVIWIYLLTADDLEKKTNMDPCYHFLSVYESDLYLEHKFISRKETMNLPGKIRKERSIPLVRSYEQSIK